MPTLGWRSSDVHAVGEVFVFATYLPLTRRRSTLRFLRDAVAIKRQLDALASQPDGGLLWYSLRADPLRNVYVTASAWRDEAAVRAFAVADPHRATMIRHRDAMGAAATTGFVLDGALLPLAPDAIDRRLVAAASADSVPSDISTGG